LLVLTLLAMIVVDIIYAAAATQPPPVHMHHDYITGYYKIYNCLPTNFTIVRIILNNKCKRSFTIKVSN